MTQTCILCDRVAQSRAGENPYLIAEFEHTIFVVGDHQFHRGYTLVLLKDHVRDVHELPPDVQAAMFRELMQATDAVVKTFQPDKINHLSLGNEVPHIHWHIMPRYTSDPNHLQNPFAQAAEFQNHMIDADTARKIAAQIRANLT